MSVLESKSQRLLVAHFIGQKTNREPLEEYDKDYEDDNEEEQLCAEDILHKSEIQFVEQSFLDYSNSPFNIAGLRFTSMALPDCLRAGGSEVLDLDTLLRNLAPASPSTKQLDYRAEGYKALMNNIRTLNCSSEKLKARCDSLINIIAVELNRLLFEVTDEWITQANAGTHYDGLRRIHFATPNSERYISPIVSATIVLIAILHCMMGVARDHCNFILKCLRCILRLAANLQNARSQIFASNHIDPIPTTLPTALQYLGLQDGLDFYVVCPSCDTLYKEDVGVSLPDRCSHVRLDGAQCNAELFAEKRRGNRSWKKPLRRFSHQPLESWLARFLSRPDVEEMLESTTTPLKQTPCRDIWGGWYLSSFPGQGKTSFFESSSDELRLVFLVYHDFFNPFSNKTAGKKRSSGLVMMVCLNLPPEVRYDMKNIYVTAMLPGPKEPTLDNINNFLRPIVDNLLEHYEPGVYISKTHKYPKGRKVRSAAPISSLDIPASRAFAGIGGHSHGCCCSFCSALVSELDDFNMTHFSERSMDDYAVNVARWKAATSQADRDKIWKDHGVRYSEWSRFPWWNPFTDTTVAPLHWIKNVLEKQVRENMGCSATIPSGIPKPPPLSRPILTTEATWGYLAILHLGEKELENMKLPEPLLRYVCRERQIFEAGSSSSRMIANLNAWRKDQNIIRPNGEPYRPDPGHAVAIAKAEYYISKPGQKPSAISANTTLPGLEGLCDKFDISRAPGVQKAELIKRLLRYYKNVSVVSVPDLDRGSGEVRILGSEVVAEVKKDMERTNIPNWLKKPPINFATIDHGKLASEEYKSLCLVSLPITLVRLWGELGGVGEHTTDDSDEIQWSELLDHFLHLSVAIRVLSYQSLTEHDIFLFEYHYKQYLADLKRLYRYNSITVVQHLGLHIPYFLRKLGPSTRYSENTCEMFIGMLEDISTNSRVGELEETLHRELIMAANLKAMTERWNFSEILEPYSEVIGDFLRTRYPGSEQASSANWFTRQSKSGPVALDQAAYGPVAAWAQSKGIRAFSRRLHICERLSRGHVVYQPFRESRNNSGILFRPRGATVAVPGRVDAILQEPGASGETPGQGRIIVLVRKFNPLTPQDAAKDPYRNHSIIGASRFNIMGLWYDAVDSDRAHIIEPNDIISHIAVCGFDSPADTMSAPCVVIVNLDMKHVFHEGQ